MSKFVHHCEDILPALDEISRLLAVDGTVDMTNYILACHHLVEVKKAIEKAHELKLGINGWEDNVK